MEQTYGFVMLPSYYEAIIELPEEYRSEGLMALCHYGIYRQMPENVSAVVRCLMKLIIPTLDSAKDKYVTSVVNGKKGGRPRKEKNPDETQVKPSENLDKDKDKDIDKDIDIDKDKEKKQSAGAAPELAAPANRFRDKDMEKETDWDAIDLRNAVAFRDADFILDPARRETFRALLARGMTEEELLVEMQKAELGYTNDRTP